MPELTCFYVMERETYEFVRILDRTFYKFYSDGLNGQIEKEIQFDLMQNVPSIFNLAVGRTLANETIDTNSVTDNKDTSKILSVVSNALIEFLWSRTEALIYLKGNTSARTRLFQIWIAKMYDQPNYRDIWIEGLANRQWFPFKKGVNFEAFLIGKK